MRKIREILRLRHERGLTHRTIARAVHVGAATVSEYLAKAAAKSLGWPLPEEFSDAKLEEVLFPRAPGSSEREVPDFAGVYEELQRHRELTLLQLWVEYGSSERLVFRRSKLSGEVGDGGLDGVGLYRMSLVSFPIYFQCKRYAGSVGAGVVRDFRGAMVGRGDKGLIITTGEFTPAARAEATRDGAPPIDLIGGDDLCDLLLEHRVGVEVTERMVREVEVDQTFFAKI